MHGPRLMMVCCALLLGSCADLLALREGKPYPSELEARACTTTGEQRCRGLDVERCDEDGVWSPHETCDAACELGVCKQPPSCDNIPLCAGGVSCCQADPVAGGSFELRYAYGQQTSDQLQYMQDAVTREVAPFALERFEVTVGRFRRFLDGYGPSRRPASDAGAYPHVAGSGWDASWSDAHQRLPLSQDGLATLLSQSGQRFDDSEEASLPVRGVNWYSALAFCIWDGARLPSEAEWSFAAVGGEDGRDYPWPDADLGSAIDDGLAAFAGSEPQPVGSHPEGRSKYGQEDLAGNLQEWVFDGYRERPERAPCADTADADAANRWACLQLQPTHGTDRVLRGGSFRDAQSQLQNVRRTAAPGERGDATIGFRCARSLAAPEGSP